MKDEVSFMKVVLMLSCFFLLTFFNCNSDNKKAQTVDLKRKEDMQFGLTGGNPHFDYKFDVKVEKNVVNIEYEVKNKTDKSYLVFNSGDTNYGLKKGVVYVEPQKDGTVEVCQKRFFEPKDAGCPDREAPIQAGASWLKSQETIKEKVSVSLPLKLFTPFDDCPLIPKMPEKVGKIKFCIGVAEADSAKVTIDSKGLVKGWTDVKDQEFLCTDVFELQ